MDEVLTANTISCPCCALGGPKIAGERGTCVRRPPPREAIVRTVMNPHSQSGWKTFFPNVPDMAERHRGKGGCVPQTE